MERKPSYLLASILLGAGAVAGDMALDNLEYVRETVTDSHSFHYDNDGEKRLNAPLRKNVRDSTLLGLGELMIAAPIIAFGIGEATGRRKE